MKKLKIKKIIFHQIRMTFEINYFFCIQQYLNYFLLPHSQFLLEDLISPHSSGGLLK